MDEPSPWDLPRLRAYAERLRARVSRPERLAVEAAPGRGTRAVERLLESVRRHESTERALAHHFETGVAEQPLRLRPMLALCQKPFQLWNVAREEFRGSLAFEAGPSYSIGKAARAEGPTGEGLPGRVEPASAVVERAEDERLFLRAEAFGRARQLRSALSQDPAHEGLGRPDDPGAPG